MVAANVGERGKPADAGHVQIQEQQVRRRIGLDDSLQRVETVGLDDSRVLDAALDRVDQSLAQQRTVIGDNKCAFDGQFLSA